MTASPHPGSPPVDLDALERRLGYRHGSGGSVRTWHFELLVVAHLLVVTWAFTGAQLLELVGAAAVLLALAHAQIADRMAEREAQKRDPDVPCWRWSRRYFMGKELLWLAYFVGHQSWSALVGVGVFLLYPLWRAWYRRRFPILEVEAKGG